MTYQQTVKRGGPVLYECAPPRKTIRRYGFVSAVCYGLMGAAVFVATISVFNALGV